MHAAELHMIRQVYQFLVHEDAKGNTILFGDIKVRFYPQMQEDIIHMAITTLEQQGIVKIGALGVIHLY